MKDPSESMYDDNYKQGALNYSFNWKEFLCDWLWHPTVLRQKKLARMGRLWHVWLNISFHLQSQILKALCDVHYKLFDLQQFMHK